MNNNTKGYTLGSLALLVMLLSAIALTFGKFNAAGKHGSSAGLRESSAPMEAAVLMQQAAAIRAAAGSLVYNYAGPGDLLTAKLGTRDGLLTLDVRDELYSDGFRMPSPATQSEIKSREWFIQLAKNTSPQPVWYAVLHFNSPTLCRELNKASGSDELTLGPRLTPKTPVYYPAQTSTITTSGVGFLSASHVAIDSYLELRVGNRSSSCVCWSAPTRCIFYAELVRL